MPRQITPATSLDNLRKEAKRWLSALRSGDAGARARLERAYPDAPVVPVLRDVQHALSREHGCENWIALKAELAAQTYDRLANDFVLAFDSQDPAALERLNAHYQRSYSFDDLWAEIWRRVYAFRQRSSTVPKNLSQARRSTDPDRAGCWIWKLARADRRGNGRRVANCRLRPRGH